MRSLKLIAICLIACTVTGCALAVGFSAAIGCAMLDKRAFDSSWSDSLILLLTILIALPGIRAGLSAIRFHRLVHWAAG